MAKLRKSSGEERHQELYSGLIRIHILYHACEEPPIFGLEMIEELRRHGYRLSPGTLYPLLHSLEKKGLLRSRAIRNGRLFRREYRATTEGRKALRVAKQRVRELFGEIFEMALEARCLCGGGPRGHSLRRTSGSQSMPLNMC